MRRLTMAVCLAVLTAAPASLAGQDHGTVTGPEQTLRNMVTAPTAADADRGVVAGFLDRSDVRAMAEQRGIDIDRLQEGVATLDAEAAADLAERVGATDQQAALVGGDTFVISSTFVIIALLVIILIVVS